MPRCNARSVDPPRHKAKAERRGNARFATIAGEGSSTSGMPTNLLLSQYEHPAGRDPVNNRGGPRLALVLLAVRRLAVSPSASTRSSKQRRVIASHSSSESSTPIESTVIFVGRADQTSSDTSAGVNTTKSNIAPPPALRHYGSGSQRMKS